MGELEGVFLVTPNPSCRFGSLSEAETTGEGAKGSNFKFDFEAYHASPDDSLFAYYLNEFQTPINDLLKDTEYPRLQVQFTQNAYEFALAKTATFIENSKDLSKADAKALFEKMNRHTETEKVQFAMSIQAAEEWQELLKDAEQFPNLEYRSVGDENTRETHQRLNGIIKPVTDAFWAKYYPPIDYRCRCSIRQHGKSAKITDKLPDNLPSVAAGLDHNAGVTGQAFNSRHPYFENVDEKDLIKGIRKQTIEDAKKTLLGKEVALDSLPKKVTFTVKGIKEAINQPFEDLNFKNTVIAKNLIPFLKNATYLGKEYPKTTKQHLLFFHFYESKIAENLYFMIEETKDGLFNFYGATDQKPKNIIK